MKCCHDFRILGTPHLVNSNIRVSSQRKLQSFHAFMRSDLHVDSRHFRFFEEFHVLLDNEKVLSPSTAVVLSDILSSASHMRTLHLTKFERLLRLDPNLLEVMANLPRLSEAFVYGLQDGAQGAQWLRNSRSPITKLFTDAAWHSMAAASSILATNLTCVFMSVLNIPSSADARFPNVHTLLLESSILIPSAHIFRVFPNVRICEYRKNYALPHYLDEWDGHHEDNLARLEQLASEQSLPDLDRLVGEADVLYESAIIRKTTSLTISAEIDDYNFQQATRLIDLCQPTILIFSIRVNSTEAQQQGYLGALLSHTGTVPTIKEIWLYFNFRMDESNAHDGIEILVRCFTMSPFISSTEDLHLNDQNKIPDYLPTTPMRIQHFAVILKFDCDDGETATVFKSSFGEKGWVAQVAQKVHSLETIAMYWEATRCSSPVANTYSINPDRSFGEPVTQLGYTSIWSDRWLDVGIMNTYYDNWTFWEDNF